MAKINDLIYQIWESIPQKNRRESVRWVLPAVMRPANNIFPDDETLFGKPIRWDESGTLATPYVELTSPEENK